MKKILISIKKNYLYFSYRSSSKTNEQKLLNTNVISDNELLFSEEYIEKNPKIVAAFIKELCDQYDIHIVAFQRNDMFDLLFKLFNKNPYVKILYLFEEVSLSYHICEALVKNNYIKQFNCYNVPSFMIELLDKHGIEVTSRNEILFTSDFMEKNNLTQFSKIFYKMSVKIDLPLSDKDLEDFEAFCRINKYLRTIHIENTNIDDIEKILAILKANKISRIKILLHDNITDEETIVKLKKINKNSKKNKINFKLIYSEDYLKANVMNQTITSILRICGTIIACLIITVIGYIGYSNYSSENKDKEIKREISEILEKASQKQQEENGEDIPEDPDDPDEVEDPTEPDDPDTPSDPGGGGQGTGSKSTKKKKTSINDSSLTSLLSINSDTVGWLKIKGTKIDYPIVQATDNEYYLKHNFYKESDRAGWPFMDFRDEPVELSKNTIFYAHNRFNSGTMFGTLQKTLEKKWYTNKNNYVIQYDTIYEKHNWKVFSIYKIDVTTDYLRTIFDGDEDWLTFANMLKDRSIYDFGVDIKPEDKIITLSTCAGSKNQQRIVLHAVIMD